MPNGGSGKCDSIRDSFDWDRQAGSLQTKTHHVTMDAPIEADEVSRYTDWSVRGGVKLVERPQQLTQTVQDTSDFGFDFAPDMCR